jgi:hypothetical protein
MAGQWISELIIRVPAVNAVHQKSYHEIGIAKALTKDVMHFITLVSEKGSTAIYIDGKLDKTVSDFSLLPIDKDLSGRLVLGNSSDGAHAWNGTFFGLTIYNQTLRNSEVRDNYNSWLKHLLPQSQAAFEQAYRGSFVGPSRAAAQYLFNERSGELVRDHSGSGHDLTISPVFQPARRTVLGMPDKSFFFNRYNLNDIAINIVGFVPFGLFLAAWLLQVKHLSAPRINSLSILVSACLSLTIELIQVYLPARNSSLMDVISNILGTASGILLFKYALPFLNKNSGDRMLSS